MGKVIPLGGVTKLDLPVEQILQSAIDRGDVDGIVIMGYTKDGDEYFASSYADGGIVVWLAEKLKKRLLEYGSEE